MAAALVPNASATTRFLGGDRLYAVIRWLLLVLIFALATFLHGVELLPPPTATLFGRIFWGYALFSALAAGMVLAPSMQRFVGWSYALDLGWLAALAYAGPGSALSYTVLFLL